MPFRVNHGLAFASPPQKRKRERGGKREGERDDISHDFLKRIGRLEEIEREKRRFGGDRKRKETIWR